MSSYSTLCTPGLHFNYSLYAVPVGWVVAMAPLWWAIGVTGKQSPGAYNNAMPKESWSKLSEKLPSQTYRRVIRAVAANDNSHTNLALFAAAIVAGNTARLPAKTLHICAGAYLTVRSLYNLAYIFIEDPKAANVRSLLYLSGVGSCLTLFTAAAVKLSRVAWEVTV